MHLLCAVWAELARLLLPLTLHMPFIGMDASIHPRLFDFGGFGINDSPSALHYTGTDYGASGQDLLAYYWLDTMADISTIIILDNVRIRGRSSRTALLGTAIGHHLALEGPVVEPASLGQDIDLEALDLPNSRSVFIAAP